MVARTTTALVAEATHIPFVVRVRTPQEAFEPFFASLITSDLSQPLSALLEQWHQTYLPRCFQNLSSREGRWESSLALILLLTQVVMPAIVEGPLPPHFERDLTEILEQVLPEDETVASVLEKNRQAAKLQKQRKKLETVFRNGRERLHQQALSERQSLQAMVQQQQQQIASLKAKSAVRVKAAFEELDALTEEVNVLARATAELQQRLASSVDRGQRLRKDEQGLLQQVGNLP